MPPSNAGAIFSRRASWNLAANRLAGRTDRRRRAGLPLLDLTESNPTHAGLGWRAEELALVLAEPACARYDPDPLGLPEARDAVSRLLADRGAPTGRESIVLTASTSEAYALLLKLLCDPGDEILVPAPSYPLHEVLCQLEAVRAVRYPLRWDGTWHVEPGAVAAAVTHRTRAMVVVSPGNPTGAVLAREELEAIEALCAERGLALLGDEVFAETALSPARSVASVRRCLAAQLGGLSKSCGLPQLKGAWIALSGPDDLRAEALARLELIADAYLSLSTPAALAIARLLPARERFLVPARARLAHNEALLRALVPAGAPFDVLPRQGGWSAVLGTAESVDEERLCLELLDQGVLVQPGFFYDFERNGYVVISLLPEPAVFGRGAEIVVETLMSFA